MKGHMEQPTHGNSIELYYHITLQHNRWQLEERKKKKKNKLQTKTMIRYLLPLLQVVLQAQWEIPKGCWLPLLHKKGHTWSKKQYKRISSLNYKSSVYSFILLSKLSSNCYDFSFCDKTKQGFMNSRNLKYAHLNIALRSPEVCRQWLNRDIQTPAWGHLNCFPVILVQYCHIVLKCFLGTTVSQKPRKNTSFLPKLSLSFFDKYWFTLPMELFFILLMVSCNLMFPNH